MGISGSITKKHVSHIFKLLTQHDKQSKTFVDIGCGIGSVNTLAFLCYDYENSIGFDTAGYNDEDNIVEVAKVRDLEERFNLMLRIVLKALKNTLPLKQYEELITNSFSRKLKIYYGTPISDLILDRKLMISMGIVNGNKGDKYVVDFYCFWYGMQIEHIWEALTNLVIPYGRQFVFSNIRSKTWTIEIERELIKNNFSCIHTFQANMHGSKCSRKFYVYRRDCEY